MLCTLSFPWHVVYFIIKYLKPTVLLGELTGKNKENDEQKQAGKSVNS